MRSEVPRVDVHDAMMARESKLVLKCSRAPGFHPREGDTIGRAVVLWREPAGSWWSRDGNLLVHSPCPSVGLRIREQCLPKIGAHFNRHVHAIPPATVALIWEVPYRCLCN